MTDCVWTHSSEGFSLRISTRESELTIGSNLPVASMDVRFDRGMNPLPPAAADATPAAPEADTPMTDAPVVFFVYDPVMITISVFFEDEGRARYIYNVDSDGNISVARNAAGLVGARVSEHGEGSRQGPLAALIDQHDTVVV